MSEVFGFLGLPVAALLLVLLSILAHGLLAALLGQRGVLDRPNERSSHQRATPRGGGLALIPLILLSWLALLAFRGQAVPQTLWILIAATLLLMAISFLDDLRNLSPWPRLAAHIIAVIAGLFVLPQDNLILQGLAPLWLDRVVAGIFWLFFLNLFNFMDGIDGLSGVEAATIGSGLALLGAMGALSLETSLAGLLLAVAVLGFLAWNWHPARLFLGDVGSIPLGFLLGFLLLKTAGEGAWIPALILPLYYLADGGITLLRRSLKGERISQSHRQHFYQRAALVLGHAKVATGVLILNLGLLALALSPLGFWALGVALALVALLLFWLESV